MAGGVAASVDGRAAADSVAAGISAAAASRIVPVRNGVLRMRDSPLWAVGKHDGPPSKQAVVVSAPYAQMTIVVSRHLVSVSHPAYRSRVILRPSRLPARA
ncbi:hypothetical protein GCM10029976_055740 [Kribbella albertanoniae]